MTTLTFPPAAPVPPPPTKDDRLLAPTRWTAQAVIPVLAAAFVILYLFPGETMRLWSWMVCPEMSAIVMGGGYLAGAFFFTQVVRSREWHRVGVGFVAVTVFASLLLLTTIRHWSTFNHDHVSFWAWLALYATTPFLLPWLWWNNRRTDPGPAPHEVRVPRGIRTAVGAGGAVQLLFAVVMFVRPALFDDWWPWELDPATTRALAAFIAFPAVTWLWFLFEDRWSSFRVTQQTATIGLVLIGLGALRVRGEFRDTWVSPAYAVSLALAVALNVVLYVAMERRARAIAG